MREFLEDKPIIIGQIEANQSATILQRDENRIPSIWGYLLWNMFFAPNYAV